MADDGGMPSNGELLVVGQRHGCRVVEHIWRLEREVADRLVDVRRVGMVGNGVGQADAVLRAQRDVSVALRLHRHLWINAKSHAGRHLLLIRRHRHRAGRRSTGERNELIQTFMQTSEGEIVVDGDVLGCHNYERIVIIK